MNDGDNTRTERDSPPPGAFRLEIADGAGSGWLRPGESVLKAAVRQGIRIPHLCMTGECGSCRCRLVRGKVRLKRDISSHVDAAALQRGHLLACQSEAQSDILLAVPGLSHGMDAGALINTGGRIKSVTELNHDIRLLTVELDEALAYRAGQYGQLCVPGHPSLESAPRCYSFSCAAQDGPQTEVQFHVRRVPGGQFTEWLFAEDRVGHALAITGPLGDFGFRDDGRAVVCVAGGSGLAPIKAMLEHMSQLPSAPDTTLFFAARSQRDLYCMDALERLQRHWPAPGRLLVLPVLSGEAPDSGWEGLRGFCTDHLERFCSLADTSFYLCGPPPMIDATLEKLRGQTPPHCIHYDRFFDRSHLAEAAA
ncbi:2Fe-2S iron-sulfur cluster-binding protein [Paraburkholderia sacchari]|uniref:2Fe-2S iron-sulfur cluster binding domain-containing protein n=1 Tax=Paraburkholderia sacchari TaxID=159450 RepID=A0A8T6ZD53_9BURK|nr:2Fe-2S iron-sulfur cluster binding domain-containing protein [Paraburkholderia sacchari]NLP62625.1 2Fe-2S iron-sulfur cluster binding domain-containing protein [Paraburkholderia sacchari]